MRLAALARQKPRNSESHEFQCWIRPARLLAKRRAALLLEPKRCALVVTHTDLSARFKHPHPEARRARGSSQPTSRTRTPNRRNDYLSRQVKQGNLLEAHARQRMVEQTNEELYTLANDANLRECFVKTTELSREEQGKLHFFLIAAMRQRE